MLSGQVWLLADGELPSPILLLLNPCPQRPLPPAFAFGMGGDSGRITTESGVVVEVHDNGCGLPKTERHRLTEPYVTTRERGTGLGLAIVKKIMEEHNGDLILHQNPEGGAVVSLRFPRSSVGLQRRDLPAKDTAVGNLVKQ